MMNTTITSAASYVTLTTSLAALFSLINVTEPPLTGSHVLPLPARQTALPRPPLSQRPTPPPRPHSPPLPQRPKPPPRLHLPPLLQRPTPPPRQHLPTLPQRPTPPPRPRSPPLPQSPTPRTRPPLLPLPHRSTPRPPQSVSSTARPPGSRQDGGADSTSTWNIGGGGGGPGWDSGGVRGKPMPTPPKLKPNDGLPNYKKNQTTMMMTTASTHEEEPTLWSTPDRLWIYGAPVLIILGTLGNTLSGVVMMSKDLRKTTTSLFLTVLAVVDTAILYTGLLRQWLVIYKGFDIRKVAAATCKMHTFLLYALNQYQAWLLVIVTIERLIAVFLPHQSKRLCTRPAAAVSLAVSAVAIGGLNAHFFWTNQYIRIQFANKYVSYCLPFDVKYAHFVRIVWPWVDFIAFSMLPFAVLVSSNIAILLRMLYSHYLRRNTLHSHGNTVKMTSMTAILITVTFSFFVTTAPISIYLIMTDTLREDSNSVSNSSLRITWVAFNLLTYTNNTVNFLLYCVSGSRFRRELINMFRRKNRIKPTSHSGTMEMPLNHAGRSTVGHTLQTNVPQTSGFSATPTPGQSRVIIPPTGRPSRVSGGNSSVPHR